MSGAAAVMTPLEPTAHYKPQHRPRLERPCSDDSSTYGVKGTPTGHVHPKSCRGRSGGAAWPRHRSARCRSGVPRRCPPPLTWRPARTPRPPPPACRPTRIPITPPAAAPPSTPFQMSFFPACLHTRCQAGGEQCWETRFSFRPACLLHAGKRPTHLAGSAASLGAWGCM